MSVGVSGSECAWPLLDRASPSCADLRPLGGHSTPQQLPGVAQDSLQSGPRGPCGAQAKARGHSTECSRRHTIKREGVLQLWRCGEDRRGWQMGQQFGFAGQTWREVRGGPGLSLGLHPWGLQGTTLGRSVT